MIIEGITVNSDTIVKTYKRFYPSFWSDLEKANNFHYLNLWGIRVSTCDTSLPDDLVGGIRVNNFNFYETVVSKASTEPSPRNIAELYDAEARAKGGAAFMAEGQYLYRYMGTNFKKFKPLPSFCPITPTKVYRWQPTQAEIKAWNNGKGRPLSSSFADALKRGAVKISTSTDTCIHKTWAKEKLMGDSAGCQVLTDDTSLKTLGSWATSHINKGYGKIFTYTLFTKEQFLTANRRISAIPVPTVRTITSTPNKQTTGFQEFLKTLFQ